MHRRQILLFSNVQLNTRTEHGGSTRRGRRKIARPVATRRPMHVVLHSTRAAGPWSLRKRKADIAIRAAMRALASSHGIRIYEFANAGSHLHLLLRAKHRRSFQDFLRAFAGVIARRITGACRGRAVGRFWDELAYSRVVSWGREFGSVRDYVIRNELETLGRLPYRTRRRSRTRVRAAPETRFMRLDE
jgi:REP element-mobilizing transposase RayT